MLLFFASFKGNFYAKSVLGHIWRRFCILKLFFQLREETEVSAVPPAERNANDIDQQQSTNHNREASLLACGFRKLQFVHILWPIIELHLRLQQSCSAFAIFPLNIVLHSLGSLVQFVK